MVLYEKVFSHAVDPRLLTRIGSSTYTKPLQVLVQLVEDLAFHRSGLVDRIEMCPIGISEVIVKKKCDCLDPCREI
jgi:hypothetical protein